MIFWFCVLYFAHTVLFVDLVTLAYFLFMSLPLVLGLSAFVYLIKWFIAIVSRSRLIITLGISGLRAGDQFVGLHPGNLNAKSHKDILDKCVFPTSNSLDEDPFMGVIWVLYGYYASLYFWPLNVYRLTGFQMFIATRMACNELGFSICNATCLVLLTST